jgi:hypothetical protein
VPHHSKVTSGSCTAKKMMMAAMAMAVGHAEATTKLYLSSSACGSHALPILRSRAHLLRPEGEVALLEPEPRSCGKRDRRPHVHEVVGRPGETSNTDHDGVDLAEPLDLGELLAQQVHDYRDQRASNGLGTAQLRHSPVLLRTNGKSKSDGETDEKGTVLSVGAEELVRAEGTPEDAERGVSKSRCRVVQRRTHAAVKKVLMPGQVIPKGASAVQTPWILFIWKLKTPVQMKVETSVAPS